MTLVAGACEGSNLFEGEVSEQAPEVEIDVQSTVDEGDSFDVDVMGSSPRGVAFIMIRVSGAATDSIRDEFSGTNAIEFSSLEVTPSGVLGGGVVTIRASVEDVNGVRSSDVTRTVTVNPLPGPPGSN